MPEYTIRIKTDAILPPPALEYLEDVVYDYLVDHNGASDALGETDVHAFYD